MTISILDILGQTVISNTSNPSKGINTNVLTLRGLKAGIYFVRLSNGSQQFTERIVKIN